MMKPIKTANRIVRLAQMRRSIYVSHWGRRTSAAFFLAMQFRVVMTFIQQGQLFEGKP